ncbi:MAG: flagellar M-ring protein FliF [Aquabacterium sp.]|nr:flagellar M-ring protein FliF [Aquabacterium sp.]
MALPMPRKLALGGGILAVLAIALSMAMMTSKGDYKVLYANLSDKDGGAIIAQLSQMNVPYKHAEGGNAILVPADKVHDVRLKLASAGLPKGSVVGYELMENQRFGVTQFQERLNFQRGLEGELTRSIESLAAVSSARVHLALPNQNGFFREQQKPSASVLVTLAAGRTLDRAQVAGIIHLVSSSVPEMSPKAVSVVDQNGSLLSESADGTHPDGLNAQQLQYVAQIEANYTKRVMDLLEPVVGRDNLRAQVTADVDFSQSEATSEEFKPNQGPQAQATVRSQQTVESQGSTPAQPTGVPGAASNQPPVPATAPINGASAPLQTAGGAGANATNSHREAVINFEVDKTVRVVRGATGTVKRLNAAVVVNHRTSTDAKGKTSTQPLSQEELDKLTALVQETIGFNEQRGDSVRVINAPFRTDKVEPDETPLWQRPEVVDLLRVGAVPAALTLLALIVVFGAIRPALKAAQAPKPRQLDAVVADDVALPALDAPQAAGNLPALEAPVDNRLEGARKLAAENPAAVANIVRGWVAKEA